MTEEVAGSTAAKLAIHPDDQELIDAHVLAMKKRKEAGTDEAGSRNALYAVLHGGRIQLFVEHGEHEGEHPKRLLHAHYPEHAEAGNEPDGVVKVYEPSGRL
jgi:hypothetical protein